MATRKKKVTRYRKPFRINIGVIIFLFIFIYVVTQVIFYFNRSHISIYEVISASLANHNTLTGLILREEEVYRAEQAGYVNYYVNNGGRVAKNDIIYTIDETGSVYKQLDEAGENETESEETVRSIQGQLEHYYKENTGNFYSVYSLRDSLMEEVLQNSGISLLSTLENVLQAYGDGNNFHVNRTTTSGIVAFYTDGYETRSRNNISRADFEAIDTQYSKTTVVNSSLVEQGQPVYKLIPSESWSLLLLIDRDQYEKLLERDYVNITLPKDNLDITVSVSVYQQDGDYFAELSLQRYMVRYVGQRFLDISISLNSISGLKIPKSAIVEKSFFKVPLEYFAEGGWGSSDELVRLTYAENGESVSTTYTVDIYYHDEEYAYISMDEELTAGDRIKKADSEDIFILSETDSLEGVYNANKGYAVFRRIEPLYDNEEFCIVADNTSYGLSEYDHIILQGELATNQAIIY